MVQRQVDIVFNQHNWSHHSPLTCETEKLQGYNFHWQPPPLNALIYCALCGLLMVWMDVCCVLLLNQSFSAVSLNYSLNVCT